MAFRRDAPPDLPEVRALGSALESGEVVVTTGLVLQELLQGFAGPKARDAILDRFKALPFLIPGRSDYIEAADLRNQCRRSGVQVGTIDALLGALCVRRNLSLLTADADFKRMAEITPLAVWPSRGRRE